ncbi:hypothetical protein [Nonomuraea helvata]|uniref:WXG100 family type VII secretion target n=1 Tax=Nonomuraea helvata TaxID=37484 RepID=A0ABV5RU57_9ACTN
MGADRGVDLSRRAIKTARTDLEEALVLLNPDLKKGDEATSAFKETGPVGQLRNDPEALSGFWPAATGFQSSANNGIAHVTSSYDNVVRQVQSVRHLLKQAMDNYDREEHDSEGRSGQAKI